jgi:hypothetical protein
MFYPILRIIRMEETMRQYKENALKEVKSCVKKLVDTEKELAELNKLVYEKREKRSLIKDELAQVIRLPEFAQLDKMKVEEENVEIQIIKPGSQKSWNISKSDLKEYLKEQPELYNYILKEQSKKLISQEYNFNVVFK